MNVETEKLVIGKKKFEYAIITLLWIVSNIVFWSWWFKAENVGTAWLYTLMTLGVMYNFTVLPTFYLFYIGHMKKPVSVSPDFAGDVKVALITLTVVGSESIEIVERQLQYMVAVSYPHDNWLLVDKCHSPELQELCEKYGVNYFSRHDVEFWGPELVAAWNNPSPPFKAKTKAGNVNAWLDAWGMDYTHFTQFDIDHNPNPDYLDKVIGFFGYPKVKWVQAPSVYKNLQYWTARGSAEQEFVLQGVLQKGFFGFAGTPMIIGSHCTYEIEAIKEIGGFQPTRAEDHLDTVMLASKGYEGVFWPEVICEGDGPETFETYLGQQFAWAYSMFQVLFQHTPRLIKDYTWRQGIQFLFAQTWYLFWSVSMVMLFILPLLSLVLDKPIMSVGYFEFAARSLLVSGVAFGMWKWSRPWHQPRKVSLSWRGILLHVARWPAVFSALIQVIMKVQKPYMITPKGMEVGEEKPFFVSSHLPNIALWVLSMIAVVVYIHRGSSSDTQGNLWFTLNGAFFMMLVYICSLLLDMNDMSKDGVKISRVVSLRLKPLVILVLMIVGFIYSANASAPLIAEAITTGDDYETLTANITVIGDVIVSSMASTVYAAGNPDGDSHEDQLSSNSGSNQSANSLTVTDGNSAAYLNGYSVRSRRSDAGWSKRFNSSSDGTQTVSFRSGNRFADKPTLVWMLRPRR